MHIFVIFYEFSIYMSEICIFYPVKLKKHKLGLFAFVLVYLKFTILEENNYSY